MPNTNWKVISLSLSWTMSLLVTSLQQKGKQTRNESEQTAGWEFGCQPGLSHSHYKALGQQFGPNRRLKFLQFFVGKPESTLDGMATFDPKDCFETKKSRWLKVSASKTVNLGFKLSSLHLMLSRFVLLLMICASCLPSHVRAVSRVWMVCLEMCCKYWLIDYRKLVRSHRI